MAGQGSDSAIGFATETTYKTGLAPTTFIPMVEANLNAARELLESGALAASRTILQTTNAAQSPEGTITIENDGQAFGLPFFYWNGGDDGHAVAALGGYITSAPTITSPSSPKIAPVAFYKSVDAEASFTSYLTEVTGAGHAQLDGLDTLANGDAFYIGHYQPFSTAILTMEGAEVNAVTATLAAHYWDGAQWVAVSGLSDGTASGGATLAQTGTVSWTLPTAGTWETLTLADGSPFFYIRFTVSAAVSTPTSINTAEVGSAGLSSGDYDYSVASVWKWDLYDAGTPFYVILPKSTNGTTHTAAAGDRIDASHTDPTGLTLPTGFTYHGTALFGSAVGPAGSQCFCCFKPGTTTTITDLGTSRDTTVVAHTTTYYQHTFTLPSSTDDPPGFSVTLDSDVELSRRMEGCRMNDFEFSIGGVNEISSMVYNWLGVRVRQVANPVAAVSIFEPIAGTYVIASIDGTADCRLTSITVSGENELEHVFGLCGVAEAQDVTSNGFRRVSGTLVRQQVDATFFTRLINGEEFALQVNFHGGPAASGCRVVERDHGLDAAAFPFGGVLDIFRCRMSSDDAPVSAGQIEETIEWTAFKDNGENTDLKLVLFNSTANYS